MNSSSKKIAFFLSLTAMLFSCASPVEPETESSSSMLTMEETSMIETSEPLSSSSEEETKNLVNPARLVRNEFGQMRMEVDGKFFLPLGAQLRLDGLMNRDGTEGSDAPRALTVAEVAPYFEAAKNLGLNELEISIDWADLEPEEDRYDFSIPLGILELANLYDMKVCFLWFGTNMCGWTNSFQVPSYIVNDPVTYPVYESSPRYSKMYGKQFFIVLDTPALLEREAKVVKAMLDEIYEWNLIDKKNPLIAIQIHNEADCLLRWRVDQSQPKMNGEVLSKERAWESNLASIRAVCDAVKQAKYKPLTRVNVCVSLGVGDFPQAEGLHYSPKDYLDIDTLDMIGDDPYSENPVAVANSVRAYMSLENNFGHVAENMGDYPQAAMLSLVAVAQGGGYLHYDLATPPFFNYMNQGSTYRMDQGLLMDDLTDKAHSPSVRALSKALQGLGEVALKANQEDFAVFNCKRLTPTMSYEERVRTTGCDINFQTDLGAFGFAVEYEDYLYLYASEDATYSFQGGEFSMVAEPGKYVDGEFVGEGEKVYKTVGYSLKGKTLYRLKIRQKNPGVSTVNEYLQ